MAVSRKHNGLKPPQFVLNNLSLQHVTSFKYLGVLLTSDLSWSQHVDYVCMKARKLIGLVYRRFYGNMDNEGLLQLYITMVRPHLEYAAQVWDPHLVKNIEKLEKVQKFALRMCLHQWDCGYNDLLDKAGLPTLRNRRMFLKQCTLFKIHAGLLYFPSDVFVRKIDRDGCLLNQFLQPHVKTNASNMSFIVNSGTISRLRTQSLVTFKRLTLPLFM